MRGFEGRHVVEEPAVCVSSSSCNRKRFAGAGAVPVNVAALPNMQLITAAANMLQRHHLEDVYIIMVLREVDRDNSHRVRQRDKIRGCITKSES